MIDEERILPGGVLVFVRSDAAVTPRRDVEERVVDLRRTMWDR